MNMRFEDSAGTSRWAYLKTDEDYRAVMTALPVNKKTIPNVVGMGLKDAVYLLENLDLKIVSKGKGRVNAQSIAAGTIIKKGQTIYLELN
jgi:cell division protein FtsI (penicillin-binding protein 3)